jgi:hypothetical protein
MSKVLRISASTPPEETTQLVLQQAEVLSAGWRKAKQLEVP